MTVPGRPTLSRRGVWQKCNSLESDALKTRYVVILDRMNGAGALGQDLSDTLEQLSSSTKDARLRKVLTKVLQRR